MVKEYVPPHSQELWEEGMEACTPWLSSLPKVWKEELGYQTEGRWGSVLFSI